MVFFPYTFEMPDGVKLSRSFFVSSLLLQEVENKS